MGLAAPITTEVTGPKALLKWTDRRSIDAEIPGPEISLMGQLAGGH